MILKIYSLEKCYLSNDDSSNDEGMIGVYENVIGIYNSDGGKQCLNYIVFLITYSDSKIFYGYINNIFGNNCYNNIIFGYYCHDNTFGNRCHDNSLTIDGKSGGVLKLKNYNINKGVNNQEIHVKFPDSDIEVNVWVSSSGEVIQEYINDYMTDSDIDEIWNTYFNEKI